MFIIDNAQEILVSGVIIHKEKPRKFKDIFSTFLMYHRCTYFLGS